MQSGNQHHSDKNRALFKQDPIGGSPRISLRDYIAKHMSGEPVEPELPTIPSFSPQTTLPVSPGRPISRHLAGQRLNSLDIEMGAGLEQYLPTPLFRLRVVKKRLSDEIADIRGKLNKYAKLPEHSEELKVRMNAMQEHLFSLELHQAQVDSELELYLSNGSLLYGFMRQSQSLQGMIDSIWVWLRQGLMKLFYGDAFETVENANTELRMLQELFAERLRDPNTSESELSQLLNQYEQTLRQVEVGSNRLKTGRA